MNHPAPPAPLRRPFPAELLTSIKSVFGERVSIAEAVRAHHGRDESPFDPQLPDAVVFARNTEEVQAIVRLCGQHDVPIIPYGNGSSLEGHLLAVQGGAIARVERDITAGPLELILAQASRAKVPMAFGWAPPTALAA